MSASARPSRSTAMQWEFWQFYWPLTLTGLAMLLGRQFQNATLAHYDNAAYELAIFARAMSAFMIFNVALAFVPQMANALVRDRQSLRTNLLFILTVAAALMVPVLGLAFTPWGRTLIGWVYTIDGATLDHVIRYLRYLTPIILLTAGRQFLVGLLVQRKLTGLVTIMNVVFLAVIVGILLYGYHAGWTAVATLVLAQVVAAAAHLVLGLLAVLWRYEAPNEPNVEPLDWAQCWSFFWPVAFTSVMFAFSRPIIYSMCGRLEQGADIVIASLRVAFDFALLFHSPINQFRHFFVTYGREHLDDMLLFIRRMALLFTALMILFLATPVSSFVLGDLMDVDDQLLVPAWQALWVLCLVPATLSVRNVMHGLMLQAKRTYGMSAGGLARNGAIYIAAHLFLYFGVLNHVTGALLLWIGFLAETLTVILPARVHLREPQLEEAEYESAD